MFRFLSLVLLFALTACQTQQGKRDGAPAWPYPTPPGPGGYEAPSRLPSGTPLPDTGTGTPSAIPSQDETQVAMAPIKPLPNVPKTAEEISSPPAMSLIRQARIARAAGKAEQAQANLERALKIEPRNVFAWSALAATYLDQKNYEQAASVAKKSNSLARGNIYVELDNYRVLYEARQALGDAAGALSAQARAEEIAAWIAAATPTP